MIRGLAVEVAVENDIPVEVSDYLEVITRIAVELDSTAVVDDG